MHPTPELVTLLLLERDREVERARLARIAACVRACCSPSLARRLASMIGLAPAAC
jgi:hypothetical protein